MTTQYRQQALSDIAAERERQISEEGWSTDHDDEHVVADWVGLIQTYTHRALLASDHNEYRRALVQVAALSVAAIESVDRVVAAGAADPLSEP